MARVVGLICGLWIAVVVMSGIAATRSLRTVDEILSAVPKAADSVKLERPALRYHAAELNRDLFRISEYVQMVLATTTLWFVRRERWALRAVVLCTAILFLQRFYVTPEITALGRQLDFAPVPLSLELTAMKSRNGMLHGVSVSLEMVKLCGLGLLAWLAIRPRGTADWDRLAR